MPKPFPFLRLGLLTFAALAIHGYHLGVEDGEIYIPAARKLLHPDLYPFAPEFFQSHAHLSLFSPILAGTAWLTHLSMDWTVFAWYLVSLFATISGCWLLARACFSTERAQWSAMLVVTAVLTMPATDTGLLLIDPYLTARSFSTPLTLITLAAFVERRYVLAGLFLAATACIHPQMSVYLVLLAPVILLADRITACSDRRIATAFEPVPATLAAGFLYRMQLQVAPASGAYREALFSRDYFFLYNWTWYHWLGVVAPLAILLWFWQANPRGANPVLRHISLALVFFGTISVAAAACLSSSPRFQMLVRLQPMRTFHLVTLLFVLLLAGIAGEYLSERWTWVIPMLAVALSIGMFVVERSTYPNSAHIEFPGRTSSNPWVQTLQWIRQNTPPDAVFAVDSRYFKQDVVDVHGFRAISERSALADYYKDSGAVAMFPALATEWKQMSDATQGLNHFSLPQFEALRQRFPDVTWTVISGPPPAGMHCPYWQNQYSVCQIP
ncbi:MAG: hypothetical protein P4L40_19500 [Terracidiphilus sp.]|nr:hypothetical protein [Terracidiphilus sp.]